MKSNPMTDLSVKAVDDLLDHLRQQTTLRKTASISDKEVALLSSHFAAMHSSLVTRLAVKIAAACRSENFPSYATYETVTARILNEELPGLTTQASELVALKGEIERKDAAIRRYISVHGVLTDDDREYLRQALTPEKATTKAGDDK